MKDPESSITSHLTMNLSHAMTSFLETWRSLRHRIQHLVRYIRWGKITVRMTCTAGDGVPAEYEYRDRKGRVIGYWAYGSWDPHLPYKDE